MRLHNKLFVTILLLIIRIETNYFSDTDTCWLVSGQVLNALQTEQALVVLKQRKRAK